MLSWLEAAGRRVVNGRRVLELEMSKVDQLTALSAAGFDVPRTVAVVGADRLVEQASAFPTPFITKHNQGGKGLGVARFDHADALAHAIEDGSLDEPVDDTWLLQEYVEPATGFIGIEIAGFEFIEAADGCMVTYDVNTNTNYNAVVDAQAGRSGAAAVARYLGGLLVERAATNQGRPRTAADGSHPVAHLRR